MSSRPRTVARLFARSLARTALAASVVATASIALIAGTEVTTAASGVTNTAPSGLNHCDPSSESITSACLAGALSDFDRARAKEGLGRMVLPSNFTSMNVPDQLFTLTNIERRDRGLPTFLLLSPNLTSFVVSAVANALDPLFPWWTQEGGSNWASPKNSLWADFMWMYDDGLGSGNIDCTSSNTSGCWGHRLNILAGYGAPRIMGAAVGPTGVATLMLGDDTHDVPAAILPWAPVSITAREYPSRRVIVTWQAPPAHGASVAGYYVRVNGHAWTLTHTRSWISPVLARGYNVVDVRSYNMYGSSVSRGYGFYVH